MRITGGKLVGLKIADGFAAHVRPTTDKVREAIFSKLEHTFEIEDTIVLDLFSGSGIVALEFISRNAKQVVSVEKDIANVKNLKTLSKDFKIQNWEIIKGDAFQYLQKSTSLFHLVFADPPYDLPGIQALVPMVLKNLQSEGKFILEHKPGLIFKEKIEESRTYSSCAITIFAK